MIMFVAYNPIGIGQGMDAAVKKSRQTNMIIIPIIGCHLPQNGEASVDEAFMDDDNDVTFGVIEFEPSRRDSSVEKAEFDM